MYPRVTAVHPHLPPRLARKWHESDALGGSSLTVEHPVNPTHVVLAWYAPLVTVTYRLDAAPALRAVTPGFSPKELTSAAATSGLSFFKSTMAAVTGMQRDWYRPPSLRTIEQLLRDDFEARVTELSNREVASGAVKRTGLDLARLMAALRAAFGAIVRAIAPPPAILAAAEFVGALRPPGRQITSTPAVTRGPTDRLSRLVHGGAWPVLLRAPGAPALS